MKTNWIKKLEKQNACSDGLAWASEYETPQAAWSACENAEWMLWAWARNCGKSGSESHRRLILCTVEIARTSLKYIKHKELKKLSRNSLDTTERWAKGDKEVTLEDVEKDVWDVFASTYYAHGSAVSAVNAVNAVWYASYSVIYAAGAAWYTASYAAGAATWHTASYAAGAATREEALKKFSDMIRKIQPWILTG